MQKKAMLRLVLILLLTSFAPSIVASVRTTLTNNDPNPLYETEFPFAYLYTPEKEFLKGRTCVLEKQYLQFSASPFFQTASRGSNLNSKLVELGDLTGRWNMVAMLPFNFPQTNSCSGPILENIGTDLPNKLVCTTESNLSCLFTSRQFTNLDASCPICQDATGTLALDPIPLLSQIRDKLLCCIGNIFRIENPTTGEMESLPYPNELKSVQGLLSLQKDNSNGLLGFFSVPIKYRKYGVRFKASTMIYKNLGASLEIGVAQISQTARFIDLTTTPTGCLPLDCATSTCSSTTNPSINCMNPFPTTQVSNGQWQQVVACIHRELMDNLDTISEVTGNNLCNYHKTSVEDLRAELFWRQAFCVNSGRGREWPRFLFVPFMDLGATIAIAKRKDPNMVFSLPAGNNGHSAVDFLIGSSLDFVDTIEIGGEAGFNHFFCQSFECFRVPTNCAQNGMYPYKTAVSIQPGNTWHIGLFMNSRYFIDHVSFWAEYLFITHDKDKISLIDPSPSQFCASQPEQCRSEIATPFVPEVLECNSQWTSQVINAGLNYDVSPNFSIGVAAQIPIARKNAYRESTFLVGLNIYL